MEIVVNVLGVFRVVGKKFTVLHALGYLLLLIHHPAFQCQRQLPDPGNGDLFGGFLNKTQLLKFIHISTGFRAADLQNVFIHITYRYIDCEFRVFIQQRLGVATARIMRRFKPAFEELAK